MPKLPWRDDDLRQEAESLIASYGHLWPTRCEHTKCTQSFPRNFTKDQGKSGNFAIRRFRCAGCKSTVGINLVLSTLRPVQQDPTAASQVVAAVMQQPVVLLAPTTTPFKIPSVPTKTIPLNQSLHVSDLDSIPEDTDMSDLNDDDDLADGSSPLMHHVEHRPEHYLTPYSPQRILATMSPAATQYFGSPLPSQFSPWTTPSHASIYPSQLSYWSGGSQSQPQMQPQPPVMHSPSLHPSQWSYLSGATPSASQAATLTQVPSTLGSPSGSPPQHTPPPVQVPEFRPSPQAESSTAAGKRRHLDASTWQQKQARLNGSFHMSPEHSGAVQQALDARDRATQEMLAANQLLMQQVQSLVSEVARLHNELQEIRQAAEAEKSAPPAPQAAPAQATASRLPTTAIEHGRDHVVAAHTTVIRPPTTSIVQERIPAAQDYAGAVRKTLSEAQLAIIQSMKPPPRPFKARQPASSAPKPDTAPVCVYFGGVQSGPLKVFKERLRTLRVRTSQIYNISFVGKSICEFLVDASYKSKFIETMSGFTFRHLPNFDPAVPQDPNVTPETKDLLKQAYTRRLTAMASTTNRGFVRDVFLNMMSAAGAAVPADLPDMTKTVSDAPGPATATDATPEISEVTENPADEVPAGTTDE
ncbi:hypothetical protein BGZ82_003718, partial [Podila clonocystis]